MRRAHGRVQRAGVGWEAGRGPVRSVSQILAATVIAISWMVVRDWRTYFAPWSWGGGGVRRGRLGAGSWVTCGCQWFPDGTHADRDGFSAFLAMFCQGSALDEGRARAAWSQWGADSLLRSSSMKSEVATGKAQLTHRAREARQSDSTTSRSGQRRDDGLSGSDSAEGSTPSKTCTPRIEVPTTHEDAFGDPSGEPSAPTRFFDGGCIENDHSPQVQGG